MHTGQELEAH